MRGGFASVFQETTHKAAVDQQAACANCSKCLVLPGQYANWGGIEPNNAPSNVNMILGNINWFGITHGQWADDTDATLAAEAA
jgi:hypothetical protein